MLQEEGDDDDSAARMMLWETNNRRAAALPPLGRVLATIFAAECREVEKNLASDSARTKQGNTLNLFFFPQFIWVAHHSVATNVFFIALKQNPKPFLCFQCIWVYITLWQPIFFHCLKTLNSLFVFNAYECTSLCGNQFFFHCLKTLNPFFVFNAYECTSLSGNRSFFIALKP